MSKHHEYPDWLRVRGDDFRLSDRDPHAHRGPDGHKMSREEAESRHAENLAALEALQFLLYAERRRSLLVVLQAIDTGGKDGAIRKTFGPLNPQGVQVAAFKRPTEEEQGHDFLWRIHRHAPEKGHIQIFNRSHYEDVLVVRVHDIVPEKVWRRRYDHIRRFEALLADSGTLVVKLLLHISKEEQRERLQARLDDPSRTWKFEKADLKERLLWDDYQQAFEEALAETSTRRAPWYVIPADRKWFRNYCISTILRETLEAAEMRFPEPEADLAGLEIT